MVNQPINLEAKTEDEPPSIRREGAEIEIPDQGEIPDSYEEISEAVDNPIEEKEETIKDYIEAEEPEEQEKTKTEELYASDPEEDDYDAEYEQEEEQEMFKEDEFFEVEVDYWTLLLPDDPIEDFRDYFPDVKENVFSKSGMPYYGGGMAKRLVKNLLAGE
jgi:hypothetical protein